MTERIDNNPARPHGPLHPLNDSSFLGVGLGGIFTHYRIAPGLRLNRGHQTQRLEASEVMSV
ncbi:hypothetical protein [Streptomyces microflavus]|uniref:hypothetical protein n=1 Tax=Streptomyces microflavus TaxID=1919 RepID=UPI0037F848C8